MTLPREVVPGRDYMITRRCSERRRSFLEKYRDAIKRHLEGITSVLFPFGTYSMKKFGKVACEPADEPEV